MTHCHYTVQYGDPKFVSITSETPEQSVTAVGRTDAQRAKLQQFGQKWTQVTTGDEFADHMKQFHSLLAGKWKSLSKPAPASSVSYQFVLEPWAEKAPRRKIGFRRVNDERAFDKTKPAAHVSRDLAPSSPSSPQFP